MGKTYSFISNDLKCNDFTICIEFIIKAHRNMQKYLFIESYERSRLKDKKVNEIKDGFLILIYILKQYFYLKNEKENALITGITGQDGSYLAELY